MLNILNSELLSETKFICPLCTKNDFSEEKLFIDHLTNCGLTEDCPYCDQCIEFPFDNFFNHIKNCEENQKCLHCGNIFNLDWKLSFLYDGNHRKARNSTLICF